MLILENQAYLQALRDYDREAGIARPTRAYWYERKLSALFPWGRVSDHTKDQLKTIGCKPITALIAPVGATTTAANAFIRANRLNAYVRYTNVQTILDVYFGNTEEYDELSGSTKLNLSDLANNITVIKAGDETPNKLTVDILNSYIECVRMSPTKAYMILCYEGSLTSFIHTYMEDQSALKLDQVISLNPGKVCAISTDTNTEINIPENVTITDDELENLKKEYSIEKLARNLSRYSEWKVDKEIRSDLACFKHFIKQEKSQGCGSQDGLGQFFFRHSDLGWVKMMEYPTPIFEIISPSEMEMLSGCSIDADIPIDQLTSPTFRGVKRDRSRQRKLPHPWELL